MQSPFVREQIENWVSDFCSSDDVRNFSGGVREYASQILAAFMISACDARGLEPNDIEEQDVKAGLHGPLASLDLPPSIRAETPALCGAFLGHLESQGRLGGGRLLGAYCRALKNSYEEHASGKSKPVVRAGSRLGRNDPCPCGSGRKYKKCCMNE